MRAKVNVKTIMKMKNREKIAAVTAYDYVSAKLVDLTGVDIILVGDSVGMVAHGFNTTLPVDMNIMLLHLSSVARAQPRALVVGDMPFLSYETSIEEAVRNAGLMMKTGADAVKLEGGLEYEETVKALVKAGIPVMGHIGLNPQRALLIGGYRKRGVTEKEREKILEDAKALERAGVFSIVIEYTSADVAKEVTQEVGVPTICIGSGPWCDGQILVFHDLLGLTESPPPFSKQYANLREIIINAVKSYVDEVKSGKFPEEKHYFIEKKD
ncbi:3-methyl-2-oxobutanoate hydroxymethyltransferase [Thermosphaera aggregans]|uniref:3-methyl-2-oxobutanoate hydroxymethyltransferase n=1 Tax=Thermosphaera aggregans (strain DSM 11486 / M11TL) TaxID=633148 RepID=D5U1C4_THEAM|nr:3-methyl-2-oxobutanoate hydroxymethyltransferase [Thermosphaera aggregans]ADG90924.1 ketopantoate hydroxymethyltransferase [Thermosphaera aggregans DSM 11486]